MLSIYSVLMLFTGFSLAVRQLWMTTVAAVSFTVT